jgi:hypothetical protein
MVTLCVPFILKSFVLLFSQLEGYLTGNLPLTSGKLVSVKTVGGITAFDEV